MFNSQRVNTDPKPWRYDLLGMIPPEKRAREATQVTGGFSYAPRDEYWSSNVNLILEDFRSAFFEVIYSDGILQETAKWWLYLLALDPEMKKVQYWGHDIVEAATPEQIDHARKVLTRLANLGD